MKQHFFQPVILLLCCFWVFQEVSAQNKHSKLLQQLVDWSTQNQLDSALFYAHQTYHQREAASPKQRGIIYYHYAKTLLGKKQYDSVALLLNKAIELQEQLTDKKNLAATYDVYSRYYLRGNRFEQRHNSPQAYAMSKKAFDLYQEIGNQKGLAQAKLNYGVLVNRMGEFFQARDLYLEALSTFESITDSLGVYNANLKLGQIYGWRDRPFYNLDSAIFYSEKAIAIAQDLAIEEKLAYAHNLAASALIRKGYEAPKFLEKGLTSAVFAKRFYQNDSMSFNFKLAYLNQGFALEALGKDAQAFAIGQDMLNRYKADTWTESEIYRLLFRIKKKQRQFEDALRYFELHRVGFDSIVKTDLRRTLSKVESSFQQIANDQEIENLAQQAKIQALELKQRNGLLIGLSIGFVLLSAGGFFYYQLYKTRKERSEASLKQRFLRSQLNPHFVFNAIGAIQEYNVKYGAVQGSEYLGTFSKLMRQILEFSREEFIAIDDEIETLENYLQIQQMLHPEGFSYQIEVDDEIIPEMEGIPPMFAQPAIENALEHGLFRKDQTHHIHIQFEKLNGDCVKLIISDNGIGFQHDQSNPLYQSLSTVISNDRLALLNSQSKQQMTYHAQNILDGDKKIIGARVEFTLPLKQV